MTSSITGFRYGGNVNDALANIVRGLSHRVVSDNYHTRPIRIGTAIVVYVTDPVNRGTYVCVGLAAGTTSENNVWGAGYDDNVIHDVRWTVGSPVWVPADVVWETSRNYSTEGVEQLMAAALTS